MTVGELTGTRRRYSEVKLSEHIAQVLGCKTEDDATITIEHYDEGIAASEIPFISALWKMKDAESKKKK